jgi:hypothetical protein
MKVKITYQASFTTIIEVSDLEEVGDATSNICIPEDENSEYKRNSFEVLADEVIEDTETTTNGRNEMKVKFYNIVWDLHHTDNEVGLPNEVILEVDDDIDVSLEGADCLSDKFGWCVSSFSFDIVDD